MNAKILLRLAAILVALLIIWTLSGCSDTPTEPFVPTDPALVQLNPKFNIRPTTDGGYDLGLVVGAGGGLESASMAALRTIRSVRFDVYVLSRTSVATLETDYLPANGVMNGETGEVSIAIATTMHYVPDAVLTSHSYAEMTLVGCNGVATVRSDLPKPLRPVVR